MNHYYYITPEEYELAAAHGVCAQTLEVRVRAWAWKKERALYTPPQKKKGLRGEWMLLAEQNGICYSTFRYRVNRLGWDKERAATQPLQDRKAQAIIAYEGSRRYPPEIISLAKQNGICYDTFRHRINKSNWSIEQAATTPVMTGREIGLMNKEERSRCMRRFFPHRAHIRKG
jgi:hypothetical protein